MNNEKIGIWKKSYWLYLNIVTGFPRLTLLFLAIITIAFMTQIPNLRRDTNPYFLADSHPSRINHRHLMSTFTGTHEMAVVGVVSKYSIFRPSTLMRLTKLSTRFKEMNLITDEDQNRLSNRLESWPIPIAAIARKSLDGGLDASDVHYLNDIRKELYNRHLLTNDDDMLIKHIRARIDPVLKVTSLATVDNITTLPDGMGMDVSPVMRTPPTTQSEADRIRRKVMENPLLVNALVSADEHVAAIRIEFNIDPDDANNMLAAYDRIHQEIDLIAKDLPPNGYEKYVIGGTPVVSANMGSLMEKDTNRLFPLVILLVGFVLFFTLRNWRSVIISIAAAFISVIWTMGTMSLLRFPINLISTMLPVFLISINITDIVHFLTIHRSYHYEFGTRGIINDEIINRQGKHIVSSTPKIAAIRRTFHDLFVPMFLTALTTIAGFIALSYTDINALKHFGLFVVIGVTYGYVINIILAPAALTLGIDPALDTQRVEWGRKARIDEENQLNRFTRTLGRFVYQYTAEILVIFISLLILATIAATNVKIENRFVGYFAKDTSIWKDDQVLNKHLGGTMPLYIMFSGPTKNFFQQADVLQAVDNIEKEIIKDRDVGYIYSFPGFIRRMNKVIHSNNQDYDRIPYTTEITYSGTEEQRDGNTSTFRLAPTAVSGTDLIAQYVVLYENSGGQDIRDVADSDFQEACSMLLLKSDRSSAAERIMNQIQDLSNKYLGPDVQVHFSGYAEVAVSTTREVVNSQTRAMWLSLLAIFIILLISYHSFFYSIVGLLPLVIANVFNLAIMSFLDISLNIGSAIVLTMAIGMGVDFAIIFLSRFREEIVGKDLKNAVITTMKYAGKGILVNFFVLAQGFSVLISSGFTAIQQLGLLIVLTMMWSAISSILLLPALAIRYPLSHASEVTRENVSETLVSSNQ